MFQALEDHLKFGATMAIGKRLVANGIDEPDSITDF